MKKKEAFPTITKAYRAFRRVPFFQCAWRMACAAMLFSLMGYLSNWLTLSHAVERTRKIIPAPQGTIRWLSDNDVAFEDYHFIGLGNRDTGASLSLGDRLFGPVPCYKIIVPIEKAAPAAYAFSGSKYIPFIVRIYCGHEYGHFEGHGALSYICLFGYAICADVRYESRHYHY